jgi:hypothetical protein
VVLVKKDEQILVMMLSDFLIDSSACLRIGNVAVFSSYFEDNNASELGNLATKN